MRGMKTRDLWRVMHERESAKAHACTSVKPTAVVSVKVAPPDPWEGCQHHKADTCGGVKLARADCQGCTIRYW